MNAIVRKIPSVARIMLGLMFTVFGANKLFHFLPQPPMSGPPAEFFGALFATGYMLPLIAATEIVAGALLLSGRFVPLALTLLAPVIVNIVAFHLFLAPSGIGPAIVAFALEVFLTWSNRSAFRPMLRARSEDARTTSGAARVGAVAAPAE
jgi:uncharacterized membrane protein YphA (DoxX/SURF4 family)